MIIYGRILGGGDAWDDWAPLGDAAAQTLIMYRRHRSLVKTLGLNEARVSELGADRTSAAIAEGLGEHAPSAEIANAVSLAP